MKQPALLGWKNFYLLVLYKQRPCSTTNLHKIPVSQNLRFIVSCQQEIPVYVMHPAIYLQPSSVIALSERTLVPASYQSLPANLQVKDAVPPLIA
jgi:hypothetical protein